MSWKRVSYVLFGVLIACNLGWLYVMVDQSVTAHYAEVGYLQNVADLRTMKLMMPKAASLTRADVLTLLRRGEPDAFIVNDSTGVHVGELRFEFEGDRLVRVGDWGRERAVRTSIH